MLSSKGIDALVEFGEKTDVILVTRSLDETRFKQLEELLLAWAEKPSKKNQAAIEAAFPFVPDADL